MSPMTEGVFRIPPSKKRIFFLDPDEVILESFSLILTVIGHEVVTCADASVGLSQALATEFDLFLLDSNMPGFDAPAMIKAILAYQPQARIFVLSSYLNDKKVHAALLAGAQGVMNKSFEISRVIDLMESKKHHN